MGYLLDTHALLWAVGNSGELSEKVRSVIVNPEKAVYVSTISLWEISIKHGLKKLHLEGLTPERLPLYIEKIGFEIIELSKDEASTYHRLISIEHKDPFDKMLAWQAINRKLVLITKDRKMNEFKNQGLKVLW